MHQGKISAKEVKEFAQQHRKELAELVEAQEALREAEGARTEAEGAVADKTTVSQKTAERLSRLRQTHQRAIRTARREAKDVTTVEREIASEEKDEAVLKSELQRVIGEIQALSEA